MTRPAWQTVPGGSIVGNTRVWRTVTFPAVLARGVRVVVLAGADAFSRLVEVEAYQAAGSGNIPPSVTLTGLVPSIISRTVSLSTLVQVP